jgi:hypothetical protein
MALMARVCAEVVYTTLAVLVEIAVTPPDLSQF